MHEILGVELKIKPGSPQRDNAGRIEELSAGVGLALVMVKKGSRGTMELADNRPFRPVDNKSPALRHHGQGPKINLLLFDIPDTLGVVGGIRIKYHQPDRQSDGGLVGHALVEAILFVIFDILKGVLDKFQ